MGHTLYASLDELLAPETLSAIGGSNITTVRCSPFSGGHAASGSRLLLVETNGGAGPRLVVKRISLAWDWIMRATADERGREALAWTSGLLDRLPPELTHPVFACARDGDGWAILMHDVSDALFPLHDPYVGTPISADANASILDALAALHERFWDDAAAADPAVGYCSPERRYGAFSPETGRREAGGPDFYPRIIREGWEALPSLVDPEFAHLLAALADDPRPLTAALARYPQTVVHGDVRPPNLGLLRDGGSAPRVLLLDWQVLGPGAPGIELAWYLYCSGPARVDTHEVSITRYHDRLAHRLGARFDDCWWQPQLALSLLGQLVRCGQDLAWAATRHESAAVRARWRAELDWWSERALAAIRWL